LLKFRFEALNPFGGFSLSLFTRSEWPDQFMLRTVVIDLNMMKAMSLDDADRRWCGWFSIQFSAFSRCVVGNGRKLFRDRFGRVL